MAEPKQPGHRLADRGLGQRSMRRSARPRQPRGIDEMAAQASHPDLKAGHVRTALTLRRLGAAAKEARAALRREPPA